MDITIREATPEDLSGLTGLATEFSRQHSRMMGGNLDRPKSEIFPLVEDYLKNEHSGYVVACDERGRLFGYRKWEYRDEFYFTMEMYVVPDERRHGVAKEMIKFFEDWVLSRGQKIACVSIAPHNTTMLNLLRSEGYDILNTIELRKSLSDDVRKPESKAEVLGLEWKTL